MANNVSSVALENMVKGFLRRVLPQSALSLYRRRKYRQKRHNVVVLVERWDLVGRWLRSTPSTYRFKRFDPQAPTVDFDVLGQDTGEKEVLGIGADVGWIAMAAQGIDQTGLSISVVGRMRVPGSFALLDHERPIEPLGVAAHRDAIAEIGGATSNDDATSIYLRLRDTGRDIALIPRPSRSSSMPQRSDPIQDTPVCVLAAVPMHDVGGGSRAAQLTLELLRRGLHVVYVSMFPSYEPTDLGLRFVHERLEQYSAGEIGWQTLARRATRPGWVLVEVPSIEAISWAEGLKGDGWRICYDIIDRWADPGLGGDWYREEMEDRLIGMADLITVSAPDLSNRAERSELIPNAVNADVFSGPAGPRPDDMPDSGGPILGYHGSLYGDWLDWDALRELALSREDSAVVLIGDARSDLPAMPQNVHFLGLKPQVALRDYVSRFDVGLIPFRLSDTTHAVSPLKVYEYLACGVPVAAPPLRSLEGLDDVHTSESLIDAVNAALAARRPDPVEALALHSWAGRVDTLVESMGIKSESHGVTRPARLFVRPAVGYQNPDRVIE